MPDPRTSALLLVAGLLALVGVSACGERPTSIAPPSAAVHLDERANRTAVTVRTGDSVVVTLHSTYWSGLASSAPRVLAPSGRPRTAPAHTCPPGSGCGTVELALRADRPGLAHITARRTSCGEARACVGPGKSFTVTVTVRRSS